MLKLLGLDKILERYEVKKREIVTWAIGVLLVFHSFIYQIGDLVDGLIQILQGMVGG